MSVPTMFKKTLLRLAMPLACALAWPAHADNYRATAISEDPRGSVIARVLASFTAHAEPAGRWYRDALAGRQVNAREFGWFSSQFETATFVSATYEFERDGRRERHTYHARSGRNDLTTGLRVHQPRVPTYSGYFSTGAASIAWDRPPPRESTVTNRPVHGDTYEDARKRDAELKIARQLESDIRSGTVPDGGRLNVYSSQVPCPSCRAALRALTQSTRVRVHVAYLGHGSPAYNLFHRQRIQHMESIQVAVDGGQTNVIRAEERHGSTEGGEETCSGEGTC